jgi:hypothetical protein
MDFRTSRELEDGRPDEVVVGRSPRNMNRGVGSNPAVALWAAEITQGGQLLDRAHGRWLGTGAWHPWRQRSTPTKRLDWWFRNNEPHLRQDAFAIINRFVRWERSQEYVVRLGATFVDIDCGRRPLD